MRSVTFSSNQESIGVYYYFLGFSVLSYIFMDIIRRADFIGSAALLLFDFSLCLTFVVFYCLGFRSSVRLQGYRSIPIEFKVFLLLLFFCVTLSVLNLAYLNIPVSVLGIRSYLLAIPMLGIGYTLAIYLYKEGKLNYSYFLNVLSFILIAIAFLQFLHNKGMVYFPLFKPLEHAVHSYGVSEITLSASVFASSKRFARFLLLMYFLIWMIKKVRNETIYPISILYFAGIFLSGSREAMLLFILFHLGSFLIVSGMRHQILKTVIYATGITCFMAVFMLTLSESVLERLSFFLSLKELGQYVNRVFAFFPFIYLDLDFSHIFTGIGVGKYGQEVGIDPALKHSTDMLIPQAFSVGEYVAGAPLIVTDSGLTKIIMEFGILGSLIYIPFFIYISRTVKDIWRFGSDPRVYATGCLVLCWFILFLKAHTMVSDIFNSAVFYFAVGILAYTVEKNKEEQTAQ